MAQIIGILTLVSERCPIQPRLTLPDGVFSLLGHLSHLSRCAHSIRFTFPRSMRPAELQSFVPRARPTALQESEEALAILQRTSIEI